MKRIFHTWEKWECYPAGFYELSFQKMDDEYCREEYRKFLGSPESFRAGLEKVLSTWKVSSEHYLSNEKMNRIAWLGQAAACAALGLPAKYRSGYFLLTEQQQKDADVLALEYLNRWLSAHGQPAVDLEGAGVKPQFIIAKEI